MEKDHAKGLPNLEVCYIVSHIFNIVICIFDGTKHPITFKDLKCVKKPISTINLKFLDELYFSLFDFFDTSDNMIFK